MPVSLELRGAGDRAFRSIVREGWGALKQRVVAADREPPRHVTREMEGHLACGDPAEGFAGLSCGGCGHQRLVRFSCKRRGFCPSCGGRRMAERAAHWLDHVIPKVATRQWVFTVPWRRRWLLARRPALADGVVGVACRRIEAWYRRATGRKDGRSGAVVALQRFGAFSRGGGRWAPVPAGSAAHGDVETLVVEVAQACEAWQRPRGFGDDDEVAGEEDDALAIVQQASLFGRAALGERAGRSTRVQRIAGREVPMPPRCAGPEGYTLHAGVSFRASDRDGLERLCRYVLRPPVAASRVERLDDEHVRVGFERAWTDGMTSLWVSPLELVERLVALVPPARANQVLYRGVLAAHAAWRKEVVPKPVERPGRKKLTKTPTDDKRPGWADLLARVFAVDGWQCVCGRTTELRTLAIRPPATIRVLFGLERATGPPAAP